MLKKLIRIKSWSIATKVFCTLFILTATLFASLAWKNLRETEELYKRQLINDSNLLLEQVNHLIDTYLESIQNMMIFLSSHENLLDINSKEEAKKFLREYGDINRSLIKAFYIVKEDGEIYSSKQVFYDILGNPNLKEMVDLAQENYGGLNWSEPYYSPISGDTIAFVIPIINENSNSISVAVAEMDLNFLERKLSPMLGGKSKTFTILSATGNPVFAEPRHPLMFYENNYLKRLKNDFVEKLKNVQSDIDEIEGATGTLVSIKSNGNRLQWSIITLIDKQYFYQNIQALYKNFRNTAGLWLLIILLISVMMTYFITNPIRQLVSKMDNVKEIENISSIKLNREDEFGLLANSYNAMMYRIKKLVVELRQMEEKKKDYELKMLQSQISPHFLYNTLACIGSLAKQHKITEVRETIKALVGLLSFSFNKSSEFITLREEIEGIKQYAYIQHIRFGDKFDLNIDVDPSALKCKIMSLTLQPIIENAIIHGIAPCKDKKVISIKGRVSGKDLILYIRDNGIGIPRDAIDSLLTTGKVREEYAAYRGFNKIGLKNVHERIRIHFGEEYGIKVKSKSQIGTIVKVSLLAVF